MAKQKLELTWIGKEKRPRLEPRILLEDPEKSYHASERISDTDQFDNKLIFGDNLLALKALESDYAGEVKCIFIDPPYNTGNAFEHYDDGLEHSIWLGMMRERLVLLRNLLSEDGSLWITIDDNEAHYLKVLCDEIFLRKNFVSSIAWEKDKGRRNDTDISSSHDHVLLYAKNRDIWKKIRNPLPRTEAQTSRYRNIDNDPRGPWLQGDNGTAKSGSDAARYPITLPSGRVLTPPSGNYWRFSRSSFELALKENRVYFGRKGDSSPVIKRYLSDVKDGVVPRTWWTAEEAGSNQSAKRDHLRKLLPDIQPFATPKPEQLISCILQIATNEGELVLDSFAGSGTTGAVAHKMGRKWIMVELEETIHTHVIPRLKKVIDGEDIGGITFTQPEKSNVTLCKKCKDSLCEKCSEKIKAKTKPKQQWFGGGGFRYYKLAPSLLQKDQWDNWVINKEYNPEMLAEALCKLQGFHYSPSETNWWQQGHSTETDFIYVTTQTLSVDYIAKISEEVGEDRSLLICCSAFKGKKDAFPNITLKKIPQTVLHQCEWDNDDYSLNVENLPQMKQDPEQGDLF